MWRPARQNTKRLPRNHRMSAWLASNPLSTSSTCRLKAANRSITLNRSRIFTCPEPTCPGGAHDSTRPKPTEQLMLRRNMSSCSGGMCSATSREITQVCCLHGSMGSVRSCPRTRPPLKRAALGPSIPDASIPAPRSASTYRPLPAPMSSTLTEWPPRLCWCWKNWTRPAVRFLSRWYWKLAPTAQRPVRSTASPCAPLMARTKNIAVGRAARARRIHTQRELARRSSTARKQQTRRARVSLSLSAQSVASST